MQVVLLCIFINWYILYDVRLQADIPPKTTPKKIKDFENKLEDGHINKVTALVKDECNKQV